LDVCPIELVFSYLDKDEITRLLSVSSPRLKVIILVALGTGMRKSEILGLKWTDVDYEKGIVSLYVTKSGKSRYIPINESVREALLSVEKRPESLYIFHKKDGTPYNCRKSFETALKQAGISGFRFHDLRHTFDSHLVMSGIDLNTVRELLGRKDIKMTLWYAHLSPDHKTRAVNVLGHKMDTFWKPEGRSDKDEKKVEVVTLSDKIV